MASDTGPAASEVKKLREAIEETYRPQPNYGIQHPPNGSGDTKRIVWWLMGGVMGTNLLVLAAFFGWMKSTSDTMIQLREDVAVIKCQLSPSCIKVNNNVK